jgi:hypothetical protein
MEQSRKSSGGAVGCEAERSQLDASDGGDLATSGLPAVESFGCAASMDAGDEPRRRGQDAEEDGRVMTYQTSVGLVAEGLQVDLHHFEGLKCEPTAGDGRRTKHIGDDGTQFFF